MTCFVILAMGAQMLQASSEENKCVPHTICGSKG